MFVNKYPYTDMHELNLDWLLGQMLQLRTDMKDFINQNVIKYADPIQWNITTQYEANTVVIEPTSGNAYISSQPVPAGVAISNTDYWSVIGNFSVLYESIKESIAAADDGSNINATEARTEGQLLWLNSILYKVLSDISVGALYITSGTGQNLQEVTIEELIVENSNNISSLTNSFNDLENQLKTSFVTPEMFGAVGDGDADDTQAIIDALDAGSVCLCANTYKTTQPIEIPSYKTLIVNGTINYTGVDCALNLVNRYVTIDGNGRINSTGNYCVKIANAHISINNINLRCTVTYTACILMESASTDAGVSDVHIDHVILYGSDTEGFNGIGLYIHTTNNGYVNENVITGLRPFYFEVGVKMYLEAGNSMNRNQFIALDCEGSNKHLYCESAGNSSIVDNFFDIRTEEFRTSPRIFIDQYFTTNKIRGRKFAPQNFSVVNPAAKILWNRNPYASNIIEGYIVSNTDAASGYGGSFHVNGEYVVFNVNSPRPGITASADTILNLNGHIDLYWPGSCVYVSSSLSAWTLDLNYQSDWCSSPIERISIARAAGTTVTIKNDTTTLFSATLLAQGEYKVLYDTYNKNSIKLEKLTTV